MATVASRARPGLWLVAAVALLSLAMFPLAIRDGSWLNIAILVLLYAGLAQAWNILGGFAGQVSLGNAAFFGIGAYAVHLLPAGLSVLLSLPVAALLAAAAALPVGALSLRTRGFFFLMTTLAFGQMLFFLFHDTPLGGGKDGVFVTRRRWSCWASPGRSRAGSAPRSCCASS